MTVGLHEIENVGTCGWGAEIHTISKISVARHHCAGPMRIFEADSAEGLEAEVLAEPIQGAHCSHQAEGISQHVLLNQFMDGCLKVHWLLETAQFHFPSKYRAAQHECVQTWKGD